MFPSQCIIYIAVKLGLNVVRWRKTFFE